MARWAKEAGRGGTTGSVPTMAFWSKFRSSRADRVVGARGRAPSPAKLRRKVSKADYEANRERQEGRRRAMDSAAQAALRRLEAQGFPGAVKMADPKRKIRAAWYLCDAMANRPHGEKGIGCYYLFSTGEVADDGGRSVTAAQSQDEIIDALNHLGVNGRGQAFR
jgi:hypothetical protein